MFTNCKISDRQLKKMLLFDLISISILIIPCIAARGAGKDGLLAIIAAGAAAVCYGLMMLCFCKQIKIDYISYSQNTLGKFFFFLFGLFYLVKFFCSAVFVLSLFTSVIHETLLANTDNRVILFWLLLVSVYYASKMMEVRARIAELLYYPVLIPLLLLFLLGFFKISPANLLPLAITGTTPVLKTGYAVLLTFSAAELILFATPSVSGADENNKFRRKVIQAIILASVFNLVVFVVVTGLLGVSGASSRLWSTISVMQMIEIPGGFVHRQDALMLSLWLSSIFTITSTLFYYLCHVTKSMTGITKQRYIMGAYAAVLFLIAMRPLNLEALAYYFGKYIAFIGFPQSILLPLLVILVGRFRKEADT